MILPSFFAGGKATENNIEVDINEAYKSLTGAEFSSFQFGLGLNIGINIKAITLGYRLSGNVTNYLDSEDANIKGGVNTFYLKVSI